MWAEYEKEREKIAKEMSKWQKEIEQVVVSAEIRDGRLRLQAGNSVSR